MLKYVFVF